MAKEAKEKVDPGKYTKAGRECKIVTRGTKAVLNMLCSLCRFQDDTEEAPICGEYRVPLSGWVWWSEQKLADACGLKRNAVIKSIGVLKKKGLISILHQGGMKGETKTSSLYRVEYDALIAGAVVPEPVQESGDDLPSNTAPASPGSLSLSEYTQGCAEQIAEIFKKKEKLNVFIMNGLIEEYIKGTHPDAMGVEMTNDNWEAILCMLEPHGGHPSKWHNILLTVVPFDEEQVIHNLVGFSRQTWGVKGWHSGLNSPKAAAAGAEDKGDKWELKDFAGIINGAASKGKLSTFELLEQMDDYVTGATPYSLGRCMTVNDWKILADRVTDIGHEVRDAAQNMDNPQEHLIDMLARYHFDGIIHDEYLETFDLDEC